MTSLEFLPEKGKSVEGEPLEWGTGKLKAAKQENLWTPKGPTWQHQGDPDYQQKYGLTKLKLSNVRINDQLLPSPQTSDMGKLMIRLPFPAEHPYASHIERKAIIPKFDSPEDPKRGVAARQHMPKYDEMPSNPYDITIISKTKGSARRHELQAFPAESEKKPLVWPEQYTDQIVKSPSEGQQQFYPIPPKVYVPNLEARSDSKIIKGNMVVSERTATAMRNVERDQWRTTYENTNTGLGSANPMKLDNMDDKHMITARTGVSNQDVDQLQQHNINTFDPPRPQEGRISRSMIPRPAPQTPRWPNPSPDPNYQRLMTLSEKEDHRLLNGQEYYNMPDTGDEEEMEEWKKRQVTSHPQHGLERLWVNEGLKERPDGLPYTPLVNAATAEQWGPIEQMSLEQHDRFQQIEAQNRWKVLEAQTAAHNLSARQHKVDIAVDKSQPKVFYDHEGTFQRERSGLYKTTYDPYTLQHALNKREMTGDHLFDISDCHKDALNLPVELNQDMAEAMRWNRTLGGPPGTVPKLNDQPSPYEAIAPFNRHKSLQQAQLQPNSATADVRTQEHGIILRESTQGDSYNTHKFLQEHELGPHVRKEPLILMSHENQDLQKVRGASMPRSRKSVTFSSEGPRVFNADGEQDTRVRNGYSSGTPLKPIPSSNFPTIYTTTPNFNNDSVVLPVKLDKDRMAVIGNPKIEMKYGKFGVSDQFASRSSNFTAPSGVSCSWGNKSSYQTLHPGSQSIDLGYKNDERFNWRVSSGKSRPQTFLLDIQNTWSRSSARKKFHHQFPETNPDLRENLIRGRQHEFLDLNAQVLRGTPVDAY